MPCQQTASSSQSMGLEELSHDDLVQFYTANRLRLQQLAGIMDLIGVDADAYTQSDLINERVYQEGQLLDEQSRILTAIFERVPTTRNEVARTMAFYNQISTLGELGMPGEGNPYAESYMRAIHSALASGAI